jgi:5'-nucleotidase
MPKYSLLLALCLALAPPADADALRVLITNDDGVEASTIHALFQVFKGAGYRVLIASETLDNSGKGGGADFFKPMGPLARDSRGGLIKAGSPGVGSLPGIEDVYYVDGSPLAATLYGLDVAAARAWGAPPDLVISGPNYGNNTGLINNSSGTVNAALISINRGVPAIAVSTAVPKRYRPFNQLSPSDPEYEDARLVLRLVAALEAHQAKAKGPLLPKGIGLNVNIPVFAPGAAKTLRFEMSDEDTDTYAVPVFTENLSTDEGPRAFGLTGLPALPGVSIHPPGPQSDAAKAGAVGGLKSEQSVIDSGRIAVSVLKGNHEADKSGRKAVESILGSLVGPANNPGSSH